MKNKIKDTIDVNNAVINTQIKENKISFAANAAAARALSVSVDLGSPGRPNSALRKSMKGSAAPFSPGFSGRNSGTKSTPALKKI